VEEEVGRLNILDDEDGLSDKELIIKQVSRINTKHRKNIRRALDDDELDEKTKNLLALEKVPILFSQQKMTSLYRFVLLLCKI
jgi:hypothetical protein